MSMEASPMVSALHQLHPAHQLQPAAAYRETPASEEAASSADAGSEAPVTTAPAMAAITQIFLSTTHLSVVSSSIPVNKMTYRSQHAQDPDANINVDLGPISDHVANSPDRQWLPVGRVGASGPSITSVTGLNSVSRGSGPAGGGETPPPLKTARTRCRPVGAGTFVDRRR